MMCTATNTIEVKLSVTSVELCLEELRRHEAIKMYRYPDSYFNYKTNKVTKSSSKKSPCKHLQNILKTLLNELVYPKHCTDLEILKLHPVYPPTFQIFSNPNLEIILPETQGQTSGTFIKKKNTDSYINFI